MFKKITVLRPGALGDTILTIPALKAVRTDFPGAEIVFIGQPAVLPLLRVLRLADRLISFEHRMVAQLFENDFDDPSSELAGTDLAVLWLRENEAVARHFRRLGARVVAAPSRPPEEAREHVSDYLLRTLAPVLGGFQNGEQIPFCALPVEIRRLADQFWKRADLQGRRVVAVHPGSGGSWKCWPAERFAAVVTKLAADNMSVLLIAGPADIEIVRVIADLSRGAAPMVIEDASLLELAAALICCCAFLGNDSGVSHLAATLGVPAVALYAPTDPAIWGIRGRRAHVLSGSTLEDISVDEVMATLEGILGMELPGDPDPGPDRACLLA